MAQNKIILHVAPSGNVYSLRTFDAHDPGGDFFTRKHWLGKINPQGVLEWEKSTSSITNPNATAGDVLFFSFADLNPDGTLRTQLEKFDSNRGLIWKRVAANGAQFSTHTVGPDGAIHVLGRFAGSIGNIQSLGDQDGMIVHYDSNSNPINQTN